MDPAALDARLEEQKAYYAARAPEYDEWWDRVGERYELGPEGRERWFAERDAVYAALAAIGPVGRTLELAAGTGNFTGALAAISETVDALDASPETLEVNRAKVGASNVTYAVADLLSPSWSPEPGAYDAVFAGFWFSHVPPELLDGFLSRVSGALKPGGRFFAVDSLKAEGTSSANDETPDRHPEHWHARRLNDGRGFTIVKVFYGPELEGTLGRAGIEGKWTSTGRFFWYAVGTKG
ncbi:S-adenosyl-L-methionine-dependent methyltransferase [Hyaloraphidium curvatum]|nr:S-adenosyl-L-methionine-dependent methyltransferase [Hyaloraphidium curvatum]